MRNLSMASAKLYTCTFACGLCILASTDAAWAADTIAQRLDSFSQRLDVAWVLGSASLVFLMQIGFMLLEAGSVRTKNAVNVVQKNLLDFAFATITFIAIGFMLAFGASTELTFFGWDRALLFVRDVGPENIAFLVFQIMFCGTVATIVSGAVAERMALRAYLACAVVVAGLIYPVFVHWSWGNALGASEGAFLANLGFVDFAGSTVIHSTGAWVALAACLVLGPRQGRFDERGRAVTFHGHSPVLAAGGAFLLFIGWMGFNGGSAMGIDGSAAPIILNTVLAGAAGAAGGYALGWRAHGGVSPTLPINGMVGGLVAVTAACHLVSPVPALVIGLIGGAVANVGNAILQNRFRLDDAVGAIGAHGLAGVFGTLAVALLAPIELLPAGTRGAQLLVQGIGIGTNFLWAFGLGIALMTALDAVMRIRVSRSDELFGLNATEHGSRMGTGHVEDAIDGLLTGTTDLTTRLTVMPGDDTERLTRLFNDLMDRLEREEHARAEDIAFSRDVDEHARVRALADAAFEAIALCVNGVVVEANAAARSVLGIGDGEMGSRLVRDLVHPGSWQSVKKQLASGDDTPHEVDVQGLDGRSFPVEMRCRTIDYRGLPTQVLAMADLRARRRSESRIRHLALHDTLTDLPNRASFNARMGEAVARANESQVGAALLLVDLDRFKTINDTYGHQNGDAVITEVANRLTNAVRSNDFVARLGGDEFAVLLPRVGGEAQAADLAGRLLAAFAAPFTLPTGETVEIGGSIGVALCPRDGDTMDEVVQAADIALYAAKNGGRNRFATFDAEIGAEYRRTQYLETELVHSVRLNQLELYFQPRLGIAGCEIESYEALLRWNHPEMGCVSPAEFIPLAERSDVIVEIGAWVLRESCRIAASDLDGAGVSVNVSPRQFRDGNFLATLESALHESGLAPSRLELEITESTLMDDDAAAETIIAGARALGVRIALDDFGTGYSSLSYLARFRFDTIKIDRSFVKAMGEDANARSIVQSIVGLADTLDLSVVAEGVEDEAQLRMVTETGCQEVQGFLVSRPQPLTSIARHVPETVSDALTRLARPAQPATLDERIAELQRMSDLLHRELMEEEARAAS